MQITSENILKNENFKNALKPYLIQWSIVYAVLMTFITLIAICILIRNWTFSQWLVSWFMDKGATFDGKNIHYSVITFGITTFGIITMGVNVSGVFVFGGNAVGVVAIGCNAVGMIAIGCNAVGVVAVGYRAIGFYALSYSEGCRGKYMLTPNRQDAKAVYIFSRLFPKLSDSVYTQ